MLRIAFLLAVVELMGTGTPRFAAHSIAAGLKDGYQVTVVDMNHDGKPDLLVVDSEADELVWFENPTWQRHVVGGRFKNMINAAAYDIDGDGIPEIALAHGFSMQADKSSGIVSLIEHRRDPRAPWIDHEIDRLATSHRLRWADIDGSGKKALVNAPLTAANAVAPEYRGRVPLVYYDPADWKRRLISDDNEGVMHGIYVFDWTGDGRDSILSASFSGIRLFRFGADRRWSSEQLSKGDPSPWPKSGASDIAVGSIRGARVLGAIEPWHGNQVVVYRQRGTRWERQVIDDTLDDTHSIAAADLDGDGSSEFVVAQRGKPYRVIVYSFTGRGWERKVLDEGGVSAASCAVADLNGDKRPDIVCIGSATANLKWYENRGR